MKRNTTERVRSSFGSMLIARPLSAIGGMAVLILLSRKLPAHEYGLYFGIWAFVEILLIATNFGLIHAVYRYVSADEHIDGSLIPQGPILRLLQWRALTLLCSAILVVVIPVQQLADLGIQVPQNFRLLLAIIIFGEGIARFIEAVLDSMLCQGSSQTSTLIRTFVRLAGISIFIFANGLDLSRVIIIEVAAALIGCSCALVLLFKKTSTKRRPNENLQHEASFARMVRFAMPAFIAQLLGILYGPDVLKLVLSATAGVSTLAVFGFAYSLAAVVQRYIPSNILAGILRPIFVTGSAKTDANELLVGLVNVVIKINWIVILPVFCFLWFGGSTILSLLSKGNYQDAGPTLSVLVLSLLPIAVHLTLSIYCLAKEAPWPTVMATALSIIGLPLGALLAMHSGSLGMAFSVGVSELIWSLACLFLLRRDENLSLSINVLGLAKQLLAATIVIITGEALVLLGVPGVLVSPIAFVAFFLCLVFVHPFTPRELEWLGSILPFKRLLKRFRFL